MQDDPYSQAQAAYAILKRELDARFPHGRYVAIAAGKIVAHAESIDGLRTPLSALGLTLDDVALDQAGVVPKFKYMGWMTTTALLGHWIKCVLTKESPPT